MKTPMTWLLAGAAFSLCAGATVALAAGQPEQTAAQQARDDARSAQLDARVDRDAARDARDKARDARDEARDRRTESREVRVYRRGDSDDRNVFVYRGADRSETLSTLLQLRPDQEPALKAFVEATRPDHDHMRDHMVRFDRDGDDKTTLQRLDDMQAKAAEQKADMDRKIAAIKTFYGQLDAKQKKAFDAMPMLMMVGPNIGPMMIPRPMPIHFYREFAPPTPPAPPVPPTPPRAPRS